MINGVPVQAKAELIAKEVTFCYRHLCETMFRVQFSKDDVRLINQNLCLYVKDKNDKKD